MNTFTALVRLGRDAELRSTATGMTVLSFNAAADSGYGQNKTSFWLRCAIFGRRAEGGLAQYLLKGTQVMVSGTLSVNEYQGKDGLTKTSLELAVSELSLVGSKTQAKPEPAAAGSGEFDYDDQIPFNRLKHEYLY